MVAHTPVVKTALRIGLLVPALIGFLVFFSFNIQRLGPKQTVTVGINLSPWLIWTEFKGIGELGKKVEVNFLSWSTAGLVAGVVLLAIRSRVK